MAAVQDGEGFSPESVVSFSKNNDWDPAIAAAPNGEVAVAWDTYDKGDYDVYFRRLRMDGGIKMDAPVPVAASNGFEARASVAYDGQSRLWVAYEASDAAWGKDFGAYETSGDALYVNHTAKVKCFQGNQALAPAGDLAAALPGPLNGQMLRRKAAPAAGLVMPNPQLSPNRKPSGAPALPPVPLNSFPKIAADPGGGIYLTYRTPLPGRGALGTTWDQNLTYLDGGEWKGGYDRDWTW